MPLPTPKVSQKNSYLCIKLELDTLLGHNSLELFADIHVNAHTTNVTKKFDSGYLKKIIGKIQSSGFTDKLLTCSKM